MVALPPPGCVVSVIPAGTPRVRVVAALEAGRCALGKERLVPSRSQPRGTLIRLGADADTAVAPPGLVDAVFSAGAPCRVPALWPRTRLATAKERLRAAGCTIGRVRAVSGARRAGMVIAYGTKPGTRLAPRAKVAIVVSRGPGRRGR
jgi:beta-lactam-binding protein with PASTA domain